MAIAASVRSVWSVNHENQTTTRLALAPGALVVAWMLRPRGRYRMRENRVRDKPMTLQEFYEQLECDEKERHDLRDYLGYLRLLQTIRQPIYPEGNDEKCQATKKSR
jgi:hypothetical protein